MEVDFEREGLLEGCDSEESRAARIHLLGQLVEDGVPLDELKRAVSEDRLALVPVERALAGSGSYTLAEVAERAGLDADFLADQRQAFGLPRPGPDEKLLTDEDLKVAEQVKRFRDAGLPDEGQLEAARIIGQSMANVAAVSRQLVGEALLRPGDSELEVGSRYVEAATQLGPIMGDFLDYAYRIHLREGLRRDAVGRAERESGQIPGGAEITVAFADLVDFTRLGEQMGTGDLGRVAGRLAGMAADVAAAPVTLVKMIGDAAMFVSNDTAPLLDAVLELVDAADAQDNFPSIRAGVASGPALNRGGDWYGRPVNLASRVASAARAGSVLTTREVRDAAGDDYRFSRAPARRFKGIEDRVPVYRARREEPDEE